jgi:hypothetical protein
MTLPITENIPELDFNFEGLKRHSFLCIFLPESSLSDDERKLRTWLLHTLVVSARHYTKARQLVLLQNNANQARDGGAIFYVLDLSEEIEGCISATYRACMAIRRMSNTNFGAFFTQQNNAIEVLGKIRNQFEHMHSQIVSGEIGNGPITITISNYGQIIQFRNLKLKTVALFNLIKDLYVAIASLYPNFDVNSRPESGGPMKLIVTANICGE